MPSFARELEQTLHNALGEASKRRHEYATLEHLLIALVDDDHSSKVMAACGVNRDELRSSVKHYLDNELGAGRRHQHRPDPDQRVPASRPAGDPARPVVGPRRGHRRQRAGRPVLRARELCGLFPAAAGHEPPRCRHLHQPRSRQGRHAGGAARSRRRRGKDRERGQEGKRPQAVHRRPQREGQGRQGRPADRPHARGRPHGADPVPPVEEQSALCRRSGRRKDRHRRRPGAQDHRGRGARGAQGRGDLRARHGRLARRHPLPRRFRGAFEVGGVGAREAAARDPVHRRDPHGDRRRRHFGRRDGRVEPAEAGAVVGRDPLHRIDHLQGVPQPFRKGPRASAPVPEDRRQRADDRGHGEDPRRAAQLVRGASQRPLHARRDQERGRAVGALHPRPQAAGQGDRRDRRGRRDADAGAAQPPQESDLDQGDRGGGRDHGADPAQVGVDRRQACAREPRGGFEARRFRPGHGDRETVERDQAQPRRPPGPRQADWQLSVLRPYRRRQNRGRAPAGVDHGHPAAAVRHVRIYGAPLGQPADRRASRLCRLRPGWAC